MASGADIKAGQTVLRLTHMPMSGRAHQDYAGDPQMPMSVRSYAAYACTPVMPMIGHGQRRLR